MPDPKSQFKLLQSALSSAPELALEILGELPSFASTHLLKAKALKDLGRNAEARSEAEKAIRLAPNSPNAALLLDELIARQAKPGSFAVLFQEPKPRAIRPDRAVRDDVAIPSEHFAPKDVLIQSALSEDAAAQAPEPVSGLVSETLARIMVKQSKFADAKKVYIQLARENPERYDYYSSLIAELDTAMQLPEGKAQQ